MKTTLALHAANHALSSTCHTLVPAATAVWALTPVAHPAACVLARAPRRLLCLPTLPNISPVLSRAVETWWASVDSNTPDTCVLL